jgi:hypothetical protein
MSAPLPAILVAALLLCVPTAAQDEPLVIQDSGSQYMFVDEDDPDLGVLVVLGGVEIEKGARRIVGDTMVLLIDASADGSASAGPSGQIIPSSRILEVFFDGNVSIEEGDEQTAGAASVHIDNRTGLLTLLDGSWKSGLFGQPLLVRFDVMRQFTGGRLEAEGAVFTTCDYAHAHWGLSTPWALVQPTADGRILKTSRSVGSVGDVPLAPIPGFHMNIDRNRPPLRRVALGNSTRFGFKVETEWGADASEVMTDVGRWVNSGPVEAEWELELDNYSRRGIFFEPSVSYRTADSYGRIWGASINDRKDLDHLDRRIEDSTRGRFDVTHRTRIDDNQTVDFELSHLSDRGFQQEYYENEFRTQKPQETYINYRNVEGNTAWSVLARTRLNDFDSQVEYLPEVERRVVGETYLGGDLDGINVTGREFVSSAELRVGVPPEASPQPPAGSLRQGSTRVGSTRVATMPFDVGEDRITLSTGYDLTGFSRSADPDLTQPTGQRSMADAVGRYALFGGATWSRTYSGVDSDYSSERWNLDGVRQVLEPLVAFNSVLELNHGPSELVAIDDIETLDKLQVFTVGLRHRVQTHQDEKVVTVIDSQVSMPVFTNQDRDNGGDTMGFVTFDTVWKPGADIFGLRDASLSIRLTADPNDSWGYLKSFASYRTALSETSEFYVSETKSASDHVRGTLGTNFVTAGVQVELTPKWTAAAFIQEDRRLNQSVRKGILLRQRAHRWFIDIELSQRRADSTLTGESDPEEEIAFRFRPAAFADNEQTLLDRIGRVHR